MLVFSVSFSCRGPQREIYNLKINLMFSTQVAIDRNTIVKENQLFCVYGNSKKKQKGKICPLSLDLV